MWWVYTKGTPGDTHLVFTPCIRPCNLLFCCCLVTKSCLTFGTPWTAACQAPLSFTVSQSLLKLMSIGLLMPSSHLILCGPLLLLPSILPNIRVFADELALHIRWPKYWRFSFSISPSNEYSGVISFRMDWLNLLAVQGTLKSLLLHHSSKASILWCSAFFIVQFSWLLERPQLWLGPLSAKWCLCFLICCLAWS